MSKIKNGGLDQYGVGPFEQQQFGTAGVEGVNKTLINQWRRHLELVLVVHGGHNVHLSRNFVQLFGQFSDVAKQ